MRTFAQEGRAVLRVLPPGVVFSVQFLGFTEVEQSKGIEVVREGIRKLKVSPHGVQLQCRGA